MTMEKKTYITPALTTVPLNPVSMIATSLGNGTTSFASVQDAADGEYGDTKYEDDYDLWDE